MKRFLSLLLSGLILCTGLVYADVASAAWSATITAQGQDLGGVDTYTVIFGVDTTAETLAAAPAPPQYSVKTALMSSDGLSSYSKDIRQDGETGYLWIFAINPHGNIGFPSTRSATVTWNPAEFGPGNFELREGFDGAGNVVVADMKSTTQYIVTGTSNTDKYYTIGFVPDSSVTPGPVDAANSTLSVDVTSAQVTTGTGGVNITVTLKDADNNPISDTDVQLSITGTGNYINGPTEGNGPTSIGTTDASGVATGVIRSTKAEAKTISAIGGTTAITATQTVTFSPGVADAGTSTISTLTPTSITSGEQATTTIIFKDQFGNDTADLGGAALTANGSVLSGSSWTVVDGGEGTGTATYTASAEGSENALQVFLGANQIGATLSVLVEAESAPTAATVAWSATINAQGQDLGGVDSYNIILGVDSSAQTLSAAPAPPQYSVKMELKSSDGLSSFSKDVRLLNGTDYLWIFAINPHGNIGFPSTRSATLSWNPDEFGPGNFELREGVDGNGNIVVADMLTTTQYIVTGTSDTDQYFTVRYTPSEPPAVPTPEITSIQLGNTVNSGYYVAAAHPDMFSNGTVWVMPGQTQGNGTSTSPTPFSSAAAPMTGVSSGYGGLLVGFSTADFTAIAGDNTLPYQNMPTNANVEIFGGAQGPINKNYISLNNTGIAAGTTATVTVNMNGSVPHLVAVMGGSAPAVTYDPAGSGTLTIQSTTFDSTNNANESFASMFGFMIFTDPSFGSTPLGIVAQTNHWVGDIFPLLPGWDTHAAVGAGAKGTITAKCGTTIAGLVGQQRNINIFFPDSAIPQIFPNDTVPDDLAAFLGSGATHVQQPGTTVTRGVTNFSTIGTLAQFTYSFASPVDTTIGIGEPVSGQEASVETVKRIDGTYRLHLSVDAEPGAIASVTVTGPAITGDPAALFDDGLHSDGMPADGEWNKVVSLASPPSIGDEYTFTIVLAAGGAPVVLTDTVSGIMEEFASNGTVSTDLGYPVLSWTAAAGAVSYGVKLFDPINGETLWYRDEITGLSVEYTGPALPVGQTYQWVVLAFDANDNSTVSDLFSIVVGPIGDDCGPQSITGTITDSSGTPIPNIWVNAYSDSFMFGRGAQTDAQGNYTINCLVKAPDYRVDVSPVNYAFQFYKKDNTCNLPAASGGVIDYSGCSPVGTSDWIEATTVDLWASNASGVNFTLGAGVSISGTVKDDQGNGVGSVWVSAWSETTGGSGGNFTNPDGTYSITGLVEADDYRVEVNDPRFPMQFYMYAGYDSQSYVPPADNDYSGLTPQGTIVWEAYTPVRTTGTNSAVGVNFIFGETGRSISGIVLKDGQPVANVWVNAWSNSQMIGNSAQTDSQGNYSIGGLPAANDYKIDVSTADVYMVFDGKFDWYDADLVDVSAGDAVNVNFFLPSLNAISGRVVDDNGDGIPGVWVNAWSESAFFGRGDQTDANGNYTIDGLASAADYRVDIWKEGYQGGFYSAGGVVNRENAELISVPPDRTNIDFTLSIGAYIEGTITLPGGATDFAGVWVNAWSDSLGFGNGSPVGNDGTYKITGLKPATDYKVDVWSEEHGFGFHKSGADNTKDWAQATLVNTATGSKSGIDITLGAGNTISGTITGLNAGEWAWVNAWSNSAFSGGGVDVVGTGSPVTYTIKGLDAAADYKVEIHPDGHQHQFYDGEAFWENATSVDSSTNPTAIDFILTAGASISGTVTDRQGNGVAGVWVDAWAPTGAWGGATTDADGNFTIGGLTDGVQYEVNIWHENYANQTAKVTTGSPEAGVVGFIVDTGITISGTVQDDSGNPLAGVWVNAWSDSTMTGRGEQTDSSGNYVIRHLKGAADYRVDAWAEGYSYQVYNNRTLWHEADLVDTTGGSATGINFTLTSGKSISGSITVPSQPGSNADIWVNAWSDSQGGMGESLSSSDFSDNGDGTWTATYQVTNLLPGSDYKVDVWSADYQHVFYKQGDTAGVSDWMLGSNVDISSDSATGIDFVLGTGRSISGTVTVPGGGSLSNLWVNAWSESAGSWGSGLVDPSDGSYTITGLASAADFKVDIWSEAFGYQVYNLKRNWENADLVSTVSGDAAAIDFNLATGKSISGRITNESGSGVTGAWVNVWSEKIRFGRSEPTKADGTYIIKGLDPASDYKLDVWSDQYGQAFYKSGADGNRTNDWMQATQIDVTAASAANIDVVLSQGGSISGRVLNDSGTPVSGAWVNAWSPAGGNGTQTATDGTYSIKGLPSSNSYTVDVWADGYAIMVYNNKTDWMNADMVDITTGSASDIDFVLSSGNSISGNVSAGGSPVPNIWVNAWSESTGSYGGASTDSSGNYTMEGLIPANDYIVDVWHESYGYQLYNGVFDWMNATPVDVSAGNQTGIDFALSAGNYISGKISLPGGDTNYSQIWVNAFSDTSFSGNGAPVKYDGTYKIVGLTPTGGYKVDVWSDDYLHVFFKEGTATGTTSWGDATPIDISSGSQTGKNITLSTGGSISGSVTANTSGVADVWLDAWSPSTESWGGAFTDGSGGYTIEGLESSATDFVVTVWPADYQVSSKTGKKAGDVVDFDLSVGYKISGTVKDSGGNAIANVWVNAWSPSLSKGNGCMAGGDGTFAINSLATAADYEVTVWTANGFISQVVDISSGDASNIILQLPDPASLTSISGTIKTPDGSVITSGEVIATVFNQGTANNGKLFNSIRVSNTDGSFEIKNLPSGNYQLKFHYSAYGSQWCGPDTNSDSIYEGQSGRDGAVVFQPGNTVNARFTSN